MKHFILQTKLYRPAPLPNLVQRQRLADRLHAGIREHRKLTLIAAPAGFGKTTLLVDWLHGLASEMKVAWVSLDEGDNDLSRFLAYVIAALQTVDPTLGEGTRSMMESGQVHTGQAQSAELILGTLLNELAMYQTGLVLVLDDYHAITEPSIHQALEQMLTYLPPQLHIAITSRNEPPIALARLRARGQMTEISAEDLRFTLDEAIQFVNQRMGLQLSRSDVMALETRTEGWAAGLQFAALRLQGLSTQQATQAFIQSLSNLDRHLGDYLAAEVLTQQSADVYDFLIRTSILTRMCANLVSNVMDIELHEAQHMLETLEQRNLFIVSLDHEQQWYRYHHLFTALLQQELKRQLSANEIAQLHLEASQWLETHDLGDAAIDHALLADDVDRAVRLMDIKISDILLRQAEFTRIRSWLERLPMVRLSTHPSILLAGVFSHLMNYDIDQCRVYLQALHTIDNVPDEIRGQMSVAEAVIMRVLGDLPAAKQHLRTALFQLPEENLMAVMMVKQEMASALLEEELVIESHQLIVEVGEMANLTNNLLLTLIVKYLLSILTTIQGDLHQAERHCLDALHTVEKMNTSTYPVSGYIHLALTRVYYEWHEMDKARHHCDLALRMGTQAGINEVLWQIIPLRISMLLLRAEQGENQTEIESQIQPLLAQRRELAQRFFERNKGSTDIHIIAELHVALRLGDFEGAARWIASKIQTNQLQLTDTPEKPLTEVITRVNSDYSPLVYYFAVAGWTLQDHAMLQTCCRLLAPMITLAEERALQNEAINFYALLSIAHHGLGQIEQAQRAITHSLHLAQSGRFIRLYADLGVPMQTVLHDAAQSGQIPETLMNYTQQILGAFPTQTPVETLPTQTAMQQHYPPQPVNDANRETTHKQPQTSLIEPLTARESEILQLVAAGLTNQQIAETLIISIGTVKRHVSNIFGKLGVTHRAQAIAQARVFGLIG